MPVDQRNAPLATIDEDGTDEENDTLEELPSFGSSGPLSNAGSLYIHGVREPEDSEAVEDMFTVDDGVSVLQQLIDKASLGNLTQSSVSLITPPFSRVSLASLVSYRTFLPIEGCYGVFLTHLCDMIDMYPTLQEAEVISSECYTTTIRLGIVHRFLLLELRREGLKPIWVRLDRTRNKFTSRARFILNGGRTRANDIVQISAIKGRLIPPGGRQENHQVFQKCPRLRELHHFMWTVVHELTAYRLFSENCWFFVSLLQQYLNDAGGEQINGRITIPGVNRGVEARIRQQAMILHNLVRAASSVWDIKNPFPTFAPTDLSFFAEYMSRSTPNLDMDSVLKKSRGSLFWLATACLHVSQGPGERVILKPEARLKQVPDVSEGQEALYTAMLGPSIDGDRGGAHILGGPLKLQLRLAERCLDIMNDQLRFNIANSPSSFLQNRDVLDLEKHTQANVSPLLSYSCRFWPLHASIAMRRGASIPSLTCFLEMRILQWLEVMSLIQSSPEEALAPLAELMTVHPAMSMLIADIMQFVKTFATPIMCSVPHIYTSTLAFTPICSVIESQQQLHPNIVRVNRGALTEWPCSLKILEGHSSFVYSIAFSPDGSRIASGSTDKTICLWDACTDSVIGERFVGHAGGVKSVAFSPHGEGIASSSDDSTIRLWDARTGASVGPPLTGHSRRVWSIAFSPDGARIASGSADNTVRLWDAHTGSVIGQPLVGHGHGVNSVAFSPDGVWVASGSDDNTVRLWDARTGTAIGQPLAGHSNRVWSVVFSPNSAQLVSGSDDKTVRLWDARTGAAIEQSLIGHSGGVKSVAFSPDGTLIASGSIDQTVRLWDARTGATIAQPLTGHSAGVRSVAFSPDGTRIASGSRDGTVRVWDAATAVGKRGYPQRNTAEGYMSKSASTTQSTSQSSMLSIGNTSPLGAELEKYSPQRASSGELILKDGWVVGPADELLLWVPPVLRTRSGKKPEPYELDLRPFTVDPTVVLDFQSFKCGTEWTQCRGSGAQ